MPVHNARPYVDEAVRSVLAQSFSQFELVIFDDGSDDGSLDLLRHWASRDSRIRLLVGERNLGPVGSSNHVAMLARAPLVARMDADDISHPERLEAQVAVLRDRPEIGLVGCLCESIDAVGRRLRGPDLWRLHQQSSLAPFPHGSIMYRRELFDRLGGYRAECEFWEDQDLVLRAARLAKVATIGRPLYHYRHSPVSTRLASDSDRVERAVDRMYRAMEALSAEGSYEELLAAPEAAPDRLDPRVFVALGSITLWGGSRPRLFKRMLKRARLRLDTRTVGAFVWTAWASVAPNSLRRLMTALAEMRNRTSTDQPDLVEWRPADPAIEGSRQNPLASGYRRPNSFSISE